jgi:amino acid adenylation domain-containing protein
VEALAYCGSARTGVSAVKESPALSGPDLGTLSARTVVDWLDHSALQYAERAAVEDGEGRSVLYRDAARLSRAVMARLIVDGVKPGDRVGVLMRKSIETLIAYQGILRSGAVYVPADPSAPPGRAALIFDDCDAAAVIVDEDCVERLRPEMDARASRARYLIVPRRTVAYVCSIDALTAAGDTTGMARQPDDLAFLLYTSGSTGTPKAVTITHRNVVDFVDWCSDAFRLTAADKIATHSPLHLSLPVFNLYAAWKHGATVVLIDEHTARVPQLVAPLIEQHQMTIWFSTPTILSLLVQSGELERIQSHSLRLILFGGEPCPVPTLQRLRVQLPHPQYFHILGSTETHMIAAYELSHEEDLNPSQPVPIGRVCARFRSRIVDDTRRDVETGSDGELCLSGPGVTRGYWKAPNDSTSAFFTDSTGETWYRTGDIVVARPDGNLVYRGRRDRRIKKRGHRVELGEIETCLYQHPKVKEAAVVAVPDTELGIKVQAFVVPRDGTRVTIIDLKTHCAVSLPRYMVPDAFVLRDALPRTSSGKMDFPTLTGTIRVA